MRGFLYAPGRSVSPRLATLRQFFLAVACVLSATGPATALDSCTAAITTPLAWLAAPAVLRSAAQPAPMLFDKARGVLRGHAGQGERAGGTGELSASGRVTLRQQRRQGRVIGAG